MALRSPLLTDTAVAVEDGGEGARMYNGTIRLCSGVCGHRYSGIVVAEASEPAAVASIRTVRLLGREAVCMESESAKEQRPRKLLFADLIRSRSHN